MERRACRGMGEKRRRGRKGKKGGTEGGLFFQAKRLTASILAGKIFTVPTLCSDLVWSGQ